MYESPIEIIQKDIVMKQENDIYKAILEQGVVVNKEELIRALQYDRGQYEKGYRDGKAHEVTHGEWRTISEYSDSKTTECTACNEIFFFMKKGQLNIDRMPYCPKCGAKMDGGANDGTSLSMRPV